MRPFARGSVCQLAWQVLHLNCSREDPETSYPWVVLHIGQRGYSRITVFCAIARFSADGPNTNLDSRVDGFGDIKSGGSRRGGGLCGWVNRLTGKALESHC